MRRLLAVLGGDVSRSLSPVLHEAAARALDLDVAYVPISCPTEGAFDAAIEALRTLGARGANVTNPHKLRALARAEARSETARIVGAVNTLCFEDDGLVFGDNTDAPGLVAVLGRLPEPSLERVQILGAGGVARAALFALAELGVRAPVVSARGGRAEVVAAEVVGRRAGALAHGLEPVAGATLVLSTLPRDEGLAEVALGRWIDRSASPIVLDLAYAGLGATTPLVHRARAAGLEAADGLELLVEQGARSLAAWTGGEVSRIGDAMRAAAGLAPRPDGVGRAPKPH